MKIITYFLCTVVSVMAYLSSALCKQSGMES